MESVRLLFTLAAQEGWRVHHMDVKSVFLNGDLKEEVYVHQLSEFMIPSKEGNMLRLCKALYGLRQTPRGGIPSWTPRSRGWAPDKARTRRSSSGGAMEEMLCW
jgi:hypothetical protein